MKPFRLHRSLVLFALCAIVSPLTVKAALAQNFTEDFNRATIGSSTVTGWESTHEVFSVVGQGDTRRLEGESVGKRSLMIWKSVPLGRIASFEAIVTPKRTVSDNWKTAGIGFATDEDNLWDLAFVEAPMSQNKRHAFELSETLHGLRNANGSGETKLNLLESSGSNVTWEFNKPYLLRISLMADRVVGDVYEDLSGGGKPIYHAAFGLKTGAVAQGRPMIEGSEFGISVANLKAQVIEIGVEPKATIPVYPPFVSTPAKADLPKFAATGFFHTASKTINGREIWWLVDPSGQATLAIGTDHTNYNAHFSKKLNYSPYNKNVSKLYPSEAAWAASATNRLKQWNFNMLGSGHSTSTRYQGLAHTQLCGFGTDFAKTAALIMRGSWVGFPDVFDPRWPAFCARRARDICIPASSDPWLVGYFIDNELEWGGKSREIAGLAKEAWTLPATSAGKKALVESLRSSYQGNLDELNADFNTKFKSFEEIQANTTATTVSNERGINALKNFDNKVARRYFTVATEAIRAADPNHMILGCRFATAVNLPTGAYFWCGKTCDVASLNIYPRIDLETGESPETDKRFSDAFAAMHKPIMVTEWSFPALDAKDSTGQPLPSQHGAGMRVDTQAQRAQAYTLMQHRLFSKPYIIGSDYFMWSDEPAQGFSDTFLEDSNYGLVDDADRPYLELTSAARLANEQAYLLHSDVIPELSAKATPEGITISNSGAVPATFDLTQWRDGIRSDSKLTLAAGASSLLPAPKPSSEPAIYWRVQCDPENKIIERDETNNSADVLLKAPNVTLTSTKTNPLAVWNPTGQTLSQVAVTWPDGRTTATIPVLGAYASTILRSGRTEMPRTGQSAIKFTRNENGYSVETDRLRLIKSGTDGQAFDSIALNKSGFGEIPQWSEMGGFTPLIYQVVEGRNVWARPSKVTEAKVVEDTPTKLILDITFESDPRLAAYPGSRTTPAAYRCAYRFTFSAGTPYFQSSVLWVGNSDSKPWNLHAYYHFLLPTNDAEAKQSIPNYWTQIGIWKSEENKLVYGALPVENKSDILIQFYKNTSVHSDCRREFDIDLAPKQRWQPTIPEPQVAIFGLPVSETNPKPWVAFQEEMQTRAAVKTTLVNSTP